ncbi:MAG: uroporphyrinogen decarboxylase family protein [Candidatus Bathyarchaeia archaeon]
MRELEGMTPRERVRNTIHFRKVDIIPWYESYYVDTVIRWLSEGLPAHRIVETEWRLRHSRTFLNWPEFKGFNLYSFFGTINLRGLIVPVDGGPIPRFKLRKIGESERYQEYLMESGAIARKLKGEHSWYSMPQFVEFPVKDMESWRRYKERLNPEDPRRYPMDWDKEAYLDLFEEYQEGSTMLYITGFYGFGAELMGIPQFNLAFYKDPELIHDMASHWEYFNIERIRDAVEALKDRIDLVFWWEDLATRHGPNISPRLYREFLLPHYKRVTGFLNKNKIDRIMMDSDGNLYPLLDLIVEAGITGLWPLEVNAGMDVRLVRERCGEKLFLAGNLDKRKVAEGGEAMMSEVDSKVPVMKESGGYIAGLDHVVPLDMSYSRFVEYAEYLKPMLATGS